MVVFYSLLFEMPMRSIQQVNSEKLCLLITTKGQFIYFVLYKWNNNKPVVIGSLTAKSKLKTCGMWQMETVAAEKNYGPLMYDLILSYTEQPLMADPTSVKPAAKAVWNHMFEDESKYVMFKKTNPNDCTSFIKDSGLMAGYGIKIKQPVDYSVLQKNHKQVLAKVLTDKVLGEQEFINLLIKKGDQYFEMRHV
jgi:hypothetical protein